MVRCKGWFDYKTKILLAFSIIGLFVGTSSTPVVYAYGVPDFGLSISQTCPTPQTCFPPEPRQIGLTARFNLLYLPLNGFSGSIIETVSGVPLASFSQGAFYLTEPTTDRLIVGSLTPDTNYQLTITATSWNGISHSVTAVLTTPKASSADSNSNGVVGSGNMLIPDFDMAITPATQAPKAGVLKATYYITYTSINGFTGPIDEKVANLPPKFVSFLSQPYPPTSGPSYGICYTRYSCTDALTVYFSIASNTQTLPSGNTYTLIVTGTAEGGFPSHSVTVTLVPP
jgi:hypothetical protein